MEIFGLAHTRSGKGFLTNLMGLGFSRPSSVQLEYLNENSSYEFAALATEYYEGLATELSVKRMLGCYSIFPHVKADVCGRLPYVLDPLVATFPDAKYVHLTRDPRTNIPNAFNQYNYGGHAFAARVWRTNATFPLVPAFGAFPMEFRIPTFHAFSPIIRTLNWDKLDQFEKNCHYWCETNRLISEKFSSGKFKYLQIRLEDLMNRDESVQELFDFIEKPMPSKELIEKCRKTPGKPLTAYKWKLKMIGAPTISEFENMSSKQKLRLIEICSATAKRCGYDLTMPES